jgi:putative endonuclease
MNYFTYILKSKITRKYYVGSTENLDERLRRHNAGHVKSTKKYRPYEIVYYEEYNSKNDAYRREMEIKSYKGGKAFKKIIEST